MLSGTATAPRPQHVPHPEATDRQLSQRGVEFLEPPTSQPWGSFAKFRDPDGNTFVLSSS